jgi:serine/threonine protein kinase
MIAGKEYKGLQVDIWSCGVILYAMLCGYLPFEDNNTDKLYKKILKCDYSIPKYISRDGADLIKKILNTNPEERYTLSDIRSHPWYTENIAKWRKLEPANSKVQLEIFKKDDPNVVNPKEIKVNPSLILDMVEKLKIPLNPTRAKNTEQTHDQDKP